MTLDGVGAFLRLEHGLVHANAAFGCAAKNGERFDVPIEVSGAPVCARASVADYPPDAPLRAAPHATCPSSAVLPWREPGARNYEDTQGGRLAWIAAPYVQSDAEALDIDWLRIALLLTGSADGPRSSSAPPGIVAVGSPRHTTSNWSYVRGERIRLYQLLPVRDSAGREGYLALSSRVSPDQAANSARSEFRVSLFSPGYELESEVVLVTTPPQRQGGYKALETQLELSDGQPMATVRYLTNLPALATSTASPEPAASAAAFILRLSLDLASRCLARSAAS
jgi:hypothetical protein